MNVPLQLQLLLQQKHHNTFLEPSCKIWLLWLCSVEAALQVGMRERECFLFVMQNMSFATELPFRLPSEPHGDRGGMHFFYLQDFGREALKHIALGKPYIQGLMLGSEPSTLRG